LALIGIAICFTQKSIADIGGLPEADRRVVVYRALEHQFVNSNWKEEAPTASCKVRNQDEPQTFSIWQYQSFKALEDCTIDIDTGCQYGMFPASNWDHDGRWAWTKSRIGHLLYLKELARTVGVPETVLKNEFGAMESLILKNIERRLKRPIRLQVYELNWGMGVVNDADTHDGSTRTWEERFAKRWNGYARSLPKQRRTEVPILNGKTDGCGAGETEYEVGSSPPGGTIRLISDMDAKLCEALRVDPWDFNSCQGWSAILSKTMGLVGTYRYVVEWPNGKTARDKFTTNQMRENKLCVPQAC
jgi:hypothetical protein